MYTRYRYLVFDDLRILMMAVHPCMKIPARIAIVVVYVAFLPLLKRAVARTLFFVFFARHTATFLLFID